MQDSKVHPEAQIRIANGEMLEAPTVDSIKLKVGERDVLKLGSVLSHPDMKVNLLSVPTSCDNGATVLYTKEKAVVRNSKGDVILEAPREGNLYVFNAEPLQKACAASLPVQDEVRKNLIHARLGHFSCSTLAKAQQANVADGLEAVLKSDCKEKGTCDG